MTESSLHRSAASPVIKLDDYTYVREPGAMEALGQLVGSASRVALDTEADSLHNYFEKVCLIQISFQDQHFIIDPLAGLELDNFFNALAAKPLILHGGDYDLRMLRVGMGFRPQREVFDTMIAAQLLGFEQIGLAALIARCFDVTLAKEGQKSDWSHRPLSDKQLSYAANDTRYLEALADRLASDLDERGRLRWHEESCRAMVAATGRDRIRDAENAWRIKGSGRLTPRQLAYLKELWYWREEQAQRLDRPPFKVFANQQIFELITWVENNHGASPTQGFKLPRNIRGTLLTTMEQALGRAASLPAAELPVRKRGARVELLSHDDLNKLTALRGECGVIAAALQIAPSTLAPKAALEAIIRRRPRNVAEIGQWSGLLDWQIELVRHSVEKCLG